MLNKALKAKWVKALRSGRYKQTTFTWVDNGAYCCLGVLCRIDLKVQNIKSNQAQGLSDHIISKLMMLNDAKKLNFKQIADWIEKSARV